MLNKIIKKAHPQLVFILSLLIIISLTGYFSRWIFISKFAAPYLLDFFDHSQWQIALSNRIMSDNELYQVAALKFLQTGQLFTVNPEVPPLGKYLYALAIKLFNQPYYASVFSYLVTIIIFYFLAKQVLQKNTQVYWSVI
ncbi:MAG: hypothetical protein GF390_03595, partial [Candidatus Pacebacteria bacterium]|nr:hypothetical protein [Candidatus Paceibacterota bacterium]